MLQTSLSLLHHAVASAVATFAHAWWNVLSRLCRGSCSRTSCCRCLLKYQMEQCSIKLVFFFEQNAHTVELLLKHLRRRQQVRRQVRPSCPDRPIAAGLCRDSASSSGRLCRCGTKPSWQPSACSEDHRLLQLAPRKKTKIV